jgi:transcriptional regulator with XRE-family HTH domain
MDPQTIRRLRAALNITQAELSEAIGYHLSQVKRWESGKAAPRAKARRAISDYAKKNGLDVDALPAVGEAVAL